MPTTREQSRSSAFPPLQVGKAGGELRRNTAGANLVGKRSEFHSIAEVSDTLDETVLLSFLGAGIEMVGPRSSCGANNS
jgi:hypothetical protein